MVGESWYLKIKKDWRINSSLFEIEDRQMLNARLSLGSWFQRNYYGAASSYQMIPAMVTAEPRVTLKSVSREQVNGTKDREKFVEGIRGKNRYCK